MWTKAACVKVSFLWSEKQEKCAKCAAAAGAFQPLIPHITPELCCGFSKGCLSR